MTNYKSMVKYLQKSYSDADQVIVISPSGKVLFSTDNWNVKNDIKAILAGWASRTAQFVVMNDIRYSIVQMEPERFIATNRNKKGHLIGAATPESDAYVIAHIKPKAKGWFHMAYPSIVRAAATLKKGVKTVEYEPKTKKKSKKNKKEKIGIKNEKETIEDKSIESYAPNQFSPTNYQQTYIDPYLKQEIEIFLEWIKNPQGLSSFISYYLQQNDQSVISSLSMIYKTLYRIINS